MILLTVSSQLEIFALSIITKKTQTISSEVSSEVSENYQTESVVDRVTNKVNEYFDFDENITGLAAFLFCIAFLKAITLFLYRYNTKIIAITVSKDLRRKYFEHIQSLPMNFYQKNNIGSLSSKVIVDSTLIAEAVNSCLVNYLQTPFTVVTTLTLCFLTSPQLSLIMFLGFPLIVYPIFFIARRIKKISKQILANQENFLSVLVDFISGIQTVKVFSMEEFSLKKYKEHNEKLAHLEKRSARYDTSSRPIVHTIGMSFLATSLIYGLYILHMNISEVVFFCGLLYVFYEPIKKFAEENNQIQKGAAAAERMYEVLDHKPEQEDPPYAKSLISFNDSIEFKDVWFKYDERWVLKGINLSIKKGQTVAIVGPTGAGKSTIAQLLPRLYGVNKGSIKIDGISVSDYTQRSLRNSIAYVPQKSFLFIDTIATNIAYGENISQELIEDAAKKAYADEFIRRLAEGYQTVLAEAGKDLSGGQQQRLSIARALAKNAPILLMDEATSSLDMVSENTIRTAVRNLKGQVTQIIIAHRLSTIEDADKIVYIDDGCKIAEGTREELMISCPEFKLMWEMMHKSKKTVMS